MRRHVRGFSLAETLFGTWFLGALTAAAVVATEPPQSQQSADGSELVCRAPSDELVSR